MRIARLQPAQLEEAAALLARAFFDYPVWAWLVPDEQHRRDVMPWFMGMSLRYGLLAGETFAAGDPLLGVAIWEPLGHLDAGVDGDFDPDGTKSGWNEMPQRMGAEFIARFDAMIETQRPVRARVSRGAPIWYLPWLGVEPAAQRSGAGTALLRDMFVRADASCVPCMLETEDAANVAYYERHRFAVAESGTLPLGGPGFWTMRREAQAV